MAKEKRKVNPLLPQLQLKKVTEDECQENGTHTFGIFFPSPSIQVHMKTGILSLDELAPSTDWSLKKMYAAVLERSLRDLTAGNHRERKEAIDWFTNGDDWSTESMITFVQTVEFLELGARELMLIEKSVIKAGGRYKKESDVLPRS